MILGTPNLKNALMENEIYLGDNCLEVSNGFLKKLT